MFRVTIKNLLARKFRLVLTSVAVMLGVAFMAGTFVLTDTMGSVFDDLFGTVNKGVDVAVQHKPAFDDPGDGPRAQAVREPLDASVLDIVTTVPGVRDAQGGVTQRATVVKLDPAGGPGENIQHGQAPSLGVSWGPNPRLSQGFQDVVGHRPNAPNQLALDEVTAEDAAVSKAAVRKCAQRSKGLDAQAQQRLVCAGAQVQVNFDAHPSELFNVVAVFQFGSSGNAAGATLAAFDTPTAQALMNRVDKFDIIRVEATPGVSATELRGDVRAALRDNNVADVEVLTGAQLADEQANEIKDQLSFFNTFLLIFAVIALFVGAFIIYNTFSIIVAQRTRELGLMRALGASGRQVMGSVAAEAFIVGLLSSILGLGLGIAVAIGLQEALRALDIDLPSGQTVIASRTIIVSILVGTVITFISAVAPARRSATVSPMAALREHPAAPSSGRRRYVVGAELALVGLLALVLGLFADLDVPGGSAGLVGIAGALVFVGVAMLSPLAVPPMGRFLGWIPAHTRGMSGTLARENAIRNPRRTASTAAALMVGLALVTLVATLGASLKSTIKDAFSTDYRAEYTLSTSGFQLLSPEAARLVRAAIPTAEVTEFRNVQVELDGEGKEFLGVDTNLAATVDIHPRSGALEAFKRDGGLLVFKDAYDDLGPAQRRSGELSVAFATGVQQIPIAGVFDENSVLFGNNYLLSMPLFNENVTDPQDTFVAVKLPDGMSLAEGRKIIETALEPLPEVEVQDRGESEASFEAQINQFLNLMYVLLALAVLIALLGIVNALALSIFERTREIGLLRAVGMVRSQVRRMIRYEAVIISVFGSLLGLALGLLFGFAMIQALGDDGISFVLPTGQIVLFIVLAAIAGLIAGWIPARRAARLNVLRAVQSE